MSRPRFAHRPVSAAPAEPFASAAEAWFWGVACLTALHEGARIAATRNGPARPCEPADILATVEHLARRRRLTARHVRTLFRFGRRCAPPDGRTRAEAAAARLWDEALDLLVTPWRRKGIVAVEGGDSDDDVVNTGVRGVS